MKSQGSQLQFCAKQQDLHGRILMEKGEKDLSSERRMFGAAGRNLHRIQQKMSHWKSAISVTTFEWKISILHYTVGRK